MVNQNQGKAYEPVQVWDRKLMRSVIKNEIIKRDGRHNISKKLHYIWEQMQNGEINAKET